ncbi:MAG: hypothetical protein ACK5TH_15640 [Prosthecobacter sp.]|jgi:hypothetical protein
MRWLALLLPLFLMNCTAEQWKRSLNPPPLVLSYDDFGPESSAVGLLGTRGPENQPVTVHQGGTRLTPGDLRVNMLQAMNHLVLAVRRMPRTAEAQPLREKLRATYSRIYPHYRTRRDAMMGAPFAGFGRGSMNRTMMLPPMPPSI